MTDQANTKEEQQMEQNPGESVEKKSELEELKEKLKKQEEELKRIKEEKLETRTNPSYFEQMREEKRRQREAKILSQNPPPSPRPSREQLEQMSQSDLVDYFQGEMSKLYRNITTEKIYPLVEQTKEDNAQAQLKQLDKVYPKWERYIPVMTPISKADPNANAVEVLKMAMAKQGDYAALNELSELLGENKGKAKGDKKMTAEKQEPDVTEERRPVPGGGEKPSVSIGNVKTPGKPMKQNDAARRAYEQVFENRS